MYGKGGGHSPGIVLSGPPGYRTASMHTRKKIMILGNCVAERLQGMLPRCPGFQREFVLVPAPMIHLLKSEAEWRAVADLALRCDIVFTQPLFSYGPCNTSALRAAMKNGQLAVFSSPNFEAYFPDAFVLRGKADMKLTPALDWDSSIIFSCFIRGVPIFDVADLYLRHPLFSTEAVRGNIAASLEQYAEREQGVDMTTGVHVVRNFAGEKLFHSPKHPVDSLLRLMLEQMAGHLGLKTPECGGVQESDSFAFNQWPVITRGHNFFRFEEQPYFVIAGQRFSIEDTAMGYYTFYEFNPHIVAANRDMATGI